MINKQIDGFDYIKSSAGIHEYRLRSNGLRVLGMTDRSAPVATFMVTYHVGSRNEAGGHTGATHFLEHLMFKGSREFNRESGTSVWTVLQDVGAQINATTWFDRTNYYELVPSEHLETAIRIEADRMRNAFINDDDRQSEMTVVANEFERGENSPFQALDKLIWGTAYQAHPYHHSTIGWYSDIVNVPTKRLKEFYDTYYWPNNATATVIGDIELEQALGLIRKHFGEYSSSPHEIPQVYTEEPAQEGARRVYLKRSGQAGILGIAHKTPEGLHRDMAAIQILGRILFDGKTSRLYRKLIEPGIATAVSVESFPLRDNGLFITYVFLSPGTDSDSVEKTVLEEYEDIKINGVSEDELKRARANIRAELAFSRDGSYSIAANLNEAIAAGDWTTYTRTNEIIEAVTTAEIQKAARIYLNEDRGTTGIFVPQNNALSNQKEMIPPGPQTIFENAKALSKSPSSKEKHETPAGSAGGFSDRVKEINIMKGFRLLTLKTGAKDVVTIAGSLPGGNRLNPTDNHMVSDVVAAMLDQGTRKRSKYEISEELENMGARLSFSSGSFRMHMNARCLKKDVSKVISILAEQMLEPRFDETDLDSVRKRMIGSLERKKENTQEQAFTALMRNLYPEDHPNYMHTPDESLAALEKITTQDLKEFHKRILGPGDVIFVVTGDIPEREIRQGFKTGFTNWKPVNIDFPVVREHAYDRNGGETTVTVNDKTSVDLYMGVPVFLDRNHPDYYALMLGAFILGGNFSARLMTTIRDQMGLTYGIHAGIQGVENGTDGFWFTWGTFGPDKIRKSIKSIRKVVDNWWQNGVTEEELETKKNTITGSFKVSMGTTKGLATALLVNAERGRKVSYLDEFPGIINNISRREVNEAIGKHIDLEKLHIAAAGSLEKI